MGKDKGFILKYLFFIFVIYVSLFAKLLNYDIKPKDFTSKTINILDAKEFKSSKKDGLKVTEISDLTYIDRVLYGVSDQGFLYLFNLKIKNKKIKKLVLKKAFALKTKKGKRFKHKKRDAEGLEHIGKDLLISFERVPRIAKFSLNGRKIKDMKIDKKLLDINSYRSPNKALESLAYSKKYGIITAPELPLRGTDICEHTLFSQKKGRFEFNACGSITALEFIDKDNIMVLLRDYSYVTGRLVITLLSMDLNSAKSKILLKMDSKKGWNIDNFEGLTKISNNLYLIVSDDNDSIFQKTLFVLFELI